MNQRQDMKDRVWMDVAKIIARLSTCHRLQVGCVLLREDGSVAGTGYNGSLPTMAHCTPETCNPAGRCFHTRHAERSALDYSTGEVRSAYVTHEPCLRCAQDLIARGVRRVFFGARYSSMSPQETAERDMLLEHFQVSWRQII